MGRWYGSILGVVFSIRVCSRIYESIVLVVFTSKVYWIGLRADFRS